MKNEPRGLNKVEKVENSTVYLLSGPAGVGKSTTSKQLVQKLPKSAYI
ncbi:hypothetical protein ACFSO7_16080 [Bacillus sp. CGMCC 1.16607]